MRRAAIAAMRVSREWTRPLASRACAHAAEAIGLALPRGLLGRASYPTCWLDTTESDRWLGPASRSFSVYRGELATRSAYARSVIARLFHAFAE
jgi:hypothetical protein